MCYNKKQYTVCKLLAGCVLFLALDQVIALWMNLIGLEGQLVLLDWKPEVEKIFGIKE